MKNIAYILIFSSFLALLAISCDEIDQPYLRDGNIIDTSACPAPDFPALSAPVQKVLLEDFTGHTCVNCPGAAVLAHNLQLQNPDRIIVMAIHAGWFANPGSDPYTMDFRCEDGEALDQFFGVSAQGNPNGMINRRGYDQTHIQGPDSWTSRISQALNVSPLVTLQLITDYDSLERKLCIHSRTSFLSNLDLGLNIAAFIMEDNIIAPQKNNDPLVGTTPDILEYNHKHVLRDGITGTWGRPLASSDTTTVSGHQITKSFPYTMPVEWVTENCKVVVFVYRTDTYEIIQVEESALME